jgi:hypothetical protein
MEKKEVKLLTIASILLGLTLSISLLASYQEIMKYSVRDVSVPIYFTVLMAILILVMTPSYLYLERYNPLLSRIKPKKVKEKKPGRLSKKRKRILEATIISILLLSIIGVFTYFYITNYDFAKIFEQFTAPIMIITGLEISVPILFIWSFFLKKKFKVLARLYSLLTLISLVSFYFYIPYIPIYIEANHPDPLWNHGVVTHILPSASHNRIIIKTSFDIPVYNPQLRIEGKEIDGEMMDTRGYFWRFDAQNLTANTTYQLLLHAGPVPLCSSWPLKTFPDPNSDVDHLRIVVFTGSGGNEATRSWYEMGQMPLSIRKKILNRALDFDPDIIIGTGDQIYYDLYFGKGPNILGQSRRAIQHNGRFIPYLPVLGTTNEIFLKNAVDSQISYLYGTACRSIPTYFILDDHEYFVNDEANAEDDIDWSLLFVWADPTVQKGISFPPNPILLELGRVARRLYLPEFLPDENRPLDLLDTNLDGSAENTSECFGTLRYGKLVEGLLYDLRRYVTLTGLTGANATFLPPKAEDWLVDRMEAEDTEYVINISPISYGWSAGKWLSWYPDVKIKVDGEPTLSKFKYKFAWQSGWFQQHNRILNASFNMENATDLFLCGDMHTQAAGYILRSGELDFSSDPIPSVLVGSLGADGGAYPSGGLRGIEAMPPNDLLVAEFLPSYEKSGFVVADFTHTDITISFFGWRMDMDNIDEIDTLLPHYIFKIPRV